ncbi:hypothetical protein [Sinomicrobium kalidii]|uniref:hypothetical protein n=1 Tax=Sinomicrobium kalidii TaxID=2900738 RepID=UPI00349E601B
MPIRKILLGMAVFAVSVSQGQDISGTEKKIAKTVAGNIEEQLEFTEKVVNINSGTMNHEGVREVGNIFRQAFDDIGFNTRWIGMPEEMNRAGHLFAEIPGEKGKKVLLIGHIDTVFEKDSPFQKMEEVNDSISHGPGGQRYERRGCNYSLCPESPSGERVAEKQAGYCGPYGR